MSASHTAVTSELLVRCLDRWAPAALHGHRDVVYVESAADAHLADAHLTGDADPDPDRQGAAIARSDAAAAMRVFGEFADLLDRHRVTMLLGGEDTGRLAVLRTYLAAVAKRFGTPDGLSVHTVVADLSRPANLRRELDNLGLARDIPIFGWFGVAEPDEPDDIESTVVGTTFGELLVCVPSSSDSSPPRRPARHASSTVVDLVDEAGQVKRLIYLASSDKALEKFKDELWAIDEYAGIRYRDPADPQAAILDISLQPQLGPLRRLLTEKLRTESTSTLAMLRTWTLRGTIYRAADATKAVQALLASGALRREPPAGRLGADTVVRLASAPSDG